MSNSIQDYKSVIVNGKRRNIYVRGHGLIPKANAVAYINDTDVSDFVMTSDIIQIQYNASTNPISRWRHDFMNGEYFYIKNVTSGNDNMGRGRIHFVEKVSYNAATQTGIANVHVFMTEAGVTAAYNTLANTRVRVSGNRSHFVSWESGRTANNAIIGFFPRFSSVMEATANTIRLEGKFVNSNSANSLDPDYIVGKTINVVSGDGAGQNSVITAYNTTSRVITVSPEFDIIPGAIANTSVKILDRSMVRIGDLYTDSHGSIAAVVMLPEIIEHDIVPDTYGWRYWRRWNNWHRRFRYYSRNVVRWENGASSVGVDAPEEEDVADANTDSSGTTTTTTTQTTNYATDPFAQTFIVDDRLHPQGVTLTSVKLLFEAKDEDYPVQIEIRPTVAGVPASGSKVKNGTALLQPDDIVTVSQDTIKVLNAANTSAFSSNTYYTQASFKAPVYLEPGKQYAIVIASASSKHKIYTAQIGDKILGTNRTISSQPYLGVLYKMQNSSRWEPFPNEDLCFQLSKATYSTNPSTIDFKLKQLPTDINNYSMQGIIDTEGTAPRYNVNVSAIYVSSVGEVKQANTKIDYSIRTTRRGGTQDPFVNLPLYTNYEFDDVYGARIITSNNESMVIRATMQTLNPDVPPSVDITALNALVVWNDIDNGTIANSDVIITNPGQDYSNPQNVTVTIAGGGGTGATGVANISAGQFIGVDITNPGYGYTGSPTVTISGGGPTINATAVIIGEDQPNGGVASSKYITRKITLADGFDGGDLRVLFSAYKPTECEIDVYYKVLSQDDADSLDNKRWTLMTKIGGISSNSISPSDLKNYIYAPGTNNLSDNKINYDGFTTFKYFAIKLVMRSTDINVIPRISNFRVIALSELL
jgi:hypothetical protein